MQLPGNNLPIDTKYVLALIDKGISLYNVGRFQDALECFDNAIAVRADFLNSKENNKENYDKNSFNNKVQYSVKVLEEEIYIDAWVYKGRILEKLGKIDEAEQCFRKAHEIVNENL